jgi:capsule polysaccharide export protein KpsE/RkpR
MLAISALRQLTSIWVFVISACTRLILFVTILSFCLYAVSPSTVSSSACTIFSPSSQVSSQAAAGLLLSSFGQAVVK